MNFSGFNNEFVFRQIGLMYAVNSTAISKLINARSTLDVELLKLE